MNTCLECHTDTYNAMFCSRKCAVTFNNRGVQHNKVKPRNCAKCGDVYFNVCGRRSRLCVKCREEFDNRSDEIDNRTLRFYWDKTGQISSPATFHEVRHHANRRNKHRLQACQRCGYSKHIEYAHIKPIISFDLDTPIKIVNAESNILLLCPNCHWEFDNGHLKLVPGMGLEPTHVTAYETAALPLS